MAITVSGLSLAKGSELLREHGVVAGQHGDGKQRGIGSARFTDGEGCDGYAFGHLHDREQGVLTGERFRQDRNAQYRQRGLGGQHAGQMGGAACAGDDQLEAAAACSSSVLKHQVGGAMRRDHAFLAGHAEFLQDLDRRPECGPVRV